MEPTNILMLQETKIQGETLLDISKKKWQKNASKAISSRGSSGGIATLWKEDQFQLVDSFETQHWIFTKLRHRAIKLSLTLFNIYVPVTYAEKKECWQTIFNVILELH